MTDLNEERYSRMLVGLDGSNPLAFMAAVGMLRVLSKALPEQVVRLSWGSRGSGWRPTLHTEAPCSQGLLIDKLHDELARGEDAPNITPSIEGGWRNLTVSPDDYAVIAAQVADEASSADRSRADFSAALGSDAFRGKKEMDKSAFRLIAGQGNQHFLPTVQQLIEKTEKKHLVDALFEDWTYEDERLSMRWDPQDDRRYALMAGKPGVKGSVPKTVRGANRLAVAALACFPTAPQGRRLGTRGFLRVQRNLMFSWPIWEPAITIATLESLLGHPEVVAPISRRDRLEPLGVVEVYRSRRIIVKRYANFTPGEPSLS